MSHETGSAKVALWGDFVNSFTLNGSYKFTNFVVKWYYGDNTVSLYTPKQDAVIDSMDDIAAVETIQAIQSHTKQLDCAKMVAVTGLTSKYMCMACNSCWREYFSSRKMFTMSHYYVN